MVAIANAIDFHGLKAIMFDIDGTLTNSDHLHFKIFSDMLIKVNYDEGRPITEAWFKANLSGMQNPIISAFLFPEWDDERRLAFIDEKERHFTELAHTELKPMPGLFEFLDWVEASGIRKVAVTNAPGPTAKLMLHALGVTDRFEALILAEDCTHAKPHPAPYLKALELLGARPEDSMVLEDSLTGVRAGVAAGIPTVGVMSTQLPGALTALGATIEVLDYVVLLDLAKAQLKQ